MSVRPLVRNSELVIQESGNELLIYDLRLSKAFCLNETSAIVWHLCDGKHGISEISDKISKLLNGKVNEDFIWLAIDQFIRDGLLENNDSCKTHLDGVSRRELIRKVGFASAITLPVLFSLIAPRASMAQSLLANCSRCAAPADCASGSCATVNSVCIQPGGFVGSSPGTLFSGTDQAECDSSEIVFCCSGSATHNGIGCTCD